MEDPVVRPLADEMVDCLAQEMAKHTNPPASVCLRPGDAVNLLLSTTQDECCSGLAWVRLAGFFPSSEVFPAQDGTPLKTGTRAWAITLELGAARCSPRPDAQHIPTCDQWTTLSHDLMDDAAAMRRAICCFIGGDEPWRRGRVLPGIYQPLAVEGGCVGGVLPVTIQGPACDCTDAGPES